jgi:membrane protein implicated in regulation of membrane protease activity
VIVGLLGPLGVDLAISAQWFLFAALSVGTLVLFRTRLRKKITTREDEVDRLEKETAVVTERIAVGATGQAELRGSTWSARNTGEMDLEVGDRCQVERVDGLVLSIRKTL